MIIGQQNMIKAARAQQCMEGPTNKVHRQAVIAQNSHKSEGMCDRAQGATPTSSSPIYAHARKSLSVTPAPPPLSVVMKKKRKDQTGAP